MINLQNDEMKKHKMKEVKLQMCMTDYFVFKVPLDNMIVLHHLEIPNYTTT
jgi:hypothetical protein